MGYYKNRQLDREFVEAVLYERAREEGAADLPEDSKQD